MRIGKWSFGARHAVQTSIIALGAAVAAIGIANPLNGEVEVTRRPFAALVGPPAPDSAALDQWGISNLDHEAVDRWVSRFTGDQRRTLEIYLERKDRYDDMIEQKLAQRGMPQELVYLAMIESGFNPTARSPKQASGLWQFISETGRRYGLTVNGRLDERNDPAKATDAALAYLGDLHERFGSWYLAAAAYNTGENRVARLMKAATGQERGTDADFYLISAQLPKETRDYVPKLVAAARIAKEPTRYGFDATEIVASAD